MAGLNVVVDFGTSGGLFSDDGHGDEEDAEQLEHHPHPQSLFQAEELLVVEDGTAGARDDHNLCPHRYENYVAHIFH